MLVLTGGDPLKRTDIYELITFARECGLEVSMTPSATPLVTRDAIGRLARSGISRLAVSLDGADAETHDRHRGVRGSFDRTFEILAAAREEGLATQVNTTLMPWNVHQIDELADLLAGTSIELWSVFFLVPVGRAASGARLTAEQCEQAFERLWRQAARQKYRIKTTEAPHYRRFVLQHRKSANAPSRLESPSVPTFGLNDGKGILFVSHTGRIYPSGFMPIVCGVFPLDHVVDVYQQSPLLLALRDADRLGGKCGRCEFRRICGGSRARAYAVTGNPLAEEPDCLYQPGRGL
jgi:radical SAM protein with 4Fe4S-binding SPASM domain